MSMTLVIAKAESIKTLAEMMQIAAQHNDVASIARYETKIGELLNSITDLVLGASFVQVDK